MQDERSKDDAEKNVQQRRAVDNVKESIIALPGLIQWLQDRLGRAMGLDIAPDLVEDDVMHELAIASRFKHGISDKGGVQEPTDQQDEEEEALRTAERLVYGWPSREADPTHAHSISRFVKSFPLDFPMGIGDLIEQRPRKVAPQVWVQHLLRYHTGHFVGGPRGQRVLWALVNVLLLSEARQRGWGIYRNVVRRAGLGLEGGRVMTKGRLRAILAEEDRMRILVGQLSTVGREVRSTTMQWAYESKKLDCAVKFLSWVPPWVRSKDPKRKKSFGEHFIAEE